MQRVSQVTFLLRIVSVESAPPAVSSPGGSICPRRASLARNAVRFPSGLTCGRRVMMEIRAFQPYKKGAQGRADDGWGGASVSEGSAIVGPVNLPAVTWETLARPRQKAGISRFFRGPASCRSHLISQGYLSTRVVCTRFFGHVAATPLAFCQPSWRPGQVR